ncbi:MAG TPA: hypothetical protein VFP89_00960 [Propionibacteriaceae bacterium]|nr:hypothetical protein [Propionibacteriaceae bacterium]
MVSSSLYSQLVPDAPAHRRTERDVVHTGALGLRQAAGRSFDLPLATPGLGRPQLVSSYQGVIDQILFAFPSYGMDDPDSVTGYRSVIEALRPGTRFVVVHHKSRRAEAEEWFTTAGHDSGNVTYVPLPDYVSFTDWAEDGYVAVTDAEDGSSYLMEPWEFPRAGDALISEAVQDYVDISSGQAPLIFQGGNCLVGSDFWLLGRDYFADSVALLDGPRPPVEPPAGLTGADFVRTLFADYVDTDRRLIVVGTRRPLPLREYYGTREADRYFLDGPADGAGTYQPIFHIDMFLTLIGPDEQGGFQVLVGSPSMGSDLLGTRSPYDLDDVYDTLAADLERAGLNVRRNPLVHRPTVGRILTMEELRGMAERPDGEPLQAALAELAAAGAGDSDEVSVRSWHHVTWNNCLVENSSTDGVRRVYMPTYGHGDNADLAVIDNHMRRMWEGLGFEVSMLADFNSFARRQGVVHCIKKYLARGE